MRASVSPGIFPQRHSAYRHPMKTTGVFVCCMGFGIESRLYKRVKWSANKLLFNWIHGKYMQSSHTHTFSSMVPWAHVSQGAAELWSFTSKWALIDAFPLVANSRASSFLERNCPSWPLGRVQLILVVLKLIKQTPRRASGGRYTGIMSCSNQLTNYWHIPLHSSTGVKTVLKRRAFWQFIHTEIHTA